MTIVEKQRIKSVLIVEDSGETSEVLRTVLERRGLKIFAATQASDGLALLREHQPSVTILDVDSDSADDRAMCKAFDEETGRSLVVLGKTRGSFATLPRERVVSKPYHYGPLIRTIEDLVEQSCAKAG